MKDWLIRALKTFVQAFFGVLVPQIIMMLNNYMEFDWGKWTTYLPLITAALAAGISAVWNLVLEHSKKPEVVSIGETTFEDLDKIDKE